tara:strand:+ start:458 stop:775 length:318 start_codon:yes stop_codon:yes gene_type:complete
MEELLQNIKNKINNDIILKIYKYYIIKYYNNYFISLKQNKYNKNMLLEEFKDVIIKYKQHFGNKYYIYIEDYNNLYNTLGYGYTYYTCSKCGYDYNKNSKCYNCQ